jgi:hypothetical protein
VKLALANADASQIVPEDSATLDGYPSDAIDANHRNMVRFSTQSDSGFVALTWQLNKWIREIIPPQGSYDMSPGKKWVLSPSNPAVNLSLVKC